MIPLGLSSNALARALNVRSACINEIVRERRGVLADTALRLARLFNTSHQFWLNLQSNYDVQCAEDAAGRSSARIQPWQGAIEHGALAKQHVARVTHSAVVRLPSRSRCRLQRQPATPRTTGVNR